MNGTHSMDDLFIFIQARSTSSRLPLKVIKPFSDKNLTILDHLHNRIEQVYFKEKIIFLIPYNDEVLKVFLTSRNFNFFEGDEENVRDRFIKAANYYNAKKIIRITGDNPFIDILHLELLIEGLLRSKSDLLSFSGLPLGMGAEGFTLKSILPNSIIENKDYHNEHVSLHIKENPTLYNIIKLKPLFDLSQEMLNNIRVTIDEESDFEVCKNIYHEINNMYFGALELNELFKKFPSIFNKNKDVKQVTFKLPTLEVKPKKKITIFYGNTNSYGSGHYERCKQLFILLQTEGYDVILSDSLPYFNDSDFYIIDSRDINIPESIPKGKVLLIDNFGNYSHEAKNFYSLPHPNYNIDSVKDNILYPAIIDISKSIINLEEKILVYAGNLPEKESDDLDSFCSTYFPSIKIIRIGGEPSKLKINWFKRLSKKEFLKELNSSISFISYFGQGIMEALYFQKKIYIYSISDYHEMLTLFLIKKFPIVNIGKIGTLNFNEKLHTKNTVTFSNNGFSSLVKIINKSI